ncbi:Hsp70 family protein [Thioclava sp. FR2]|uniref:Hsp70 family protein n=1 Tax=Thioclava sp. FR2 TaxID=3445780 RepID=UPI003EB6E3D9
MHFGIDLGTTNSLISVFRDGKAELVPNALGDVLTPSVVALQNGQLVVGAAARRIAIAEPSMAAAVFKRGMGTDRAFRLGSKDFGAPELSAMILGALKADAEAHLGVEVREAVVSVPAYFNELQRKAVRSAGALAGLHISRLINEPTAAALAYGLHEREAEGRVLVIDLGGGTFDISLLEMFDGVIEVRASSGDAFLGGEDFTESLAKYMAAQWAVDPHDTELRPILLDLAERTKRKLTQETKASVSTTLNGAEKTLEITRERFDEITAPLITRLNAPLDRALNDTTTSPEEIGRIILVGGATRMPGIRNWVTRKLRQFPTVGLDPDHVVALGAAVQAGLIANDAGLEDMVMTDVAAFTLGVETSVLAGTNIRSGYFTPLIERNSVIPTSRSEQFHAMELGQTEVVFRIFQGESPLVRNNLYLGEVKVPVPRNMNEREGVTVRFTYDVSGLLEVDVKANSTGKTANLVIDKLAGEMSKADIAVALKKMAGLKTHPRDEAENIYLRSRIEAAYAMAHGEARTWVAGLLVQFDTAVEAQDKHALKALRPDLHKALDAFEAGHVN